MMRNLVPKIVPIPIRQDGLALTDTSGATKKALFKIEHKSKEGLQL
jgi:hypothetical protein